jgi:hypothetical protein
MSIPLPLTGSLLKQYNNVATTPPAAPLGAVINTLYAGGSAFSFVPASALLRPPPLTGTVDSFDTGNATVVFLSEDGGAPTRRINGIKARADGQAVYLINATTGGGDIILGSEKSAVPADNMLLAGSGAIGVTVGPGAGVALVYNATAGLWNTLSMTLGVITT